MAILAAFMIIIAIGFFLGVIGVLMDNELAIVGVSMSVIMLIVLLLLGCFGMVFYVNNSL
jgi:hypothetical protein